MITLFHRLLKNRFLRFRSILVQHLNSSSKLPLTICLQNVFLEDSQVQNHDKFPDGYIMELDKNEWGSLKSKYSTSIKGGKVKIPSVFTEKGLYMLATILKSPQAIQATLSIIETFSKIRELSRSIKKLSTVQDKADQKSLMKRSGELITEIFDDDLRTSDTETTIELNFAVLKFKHTIKKKNKNHKG